MGVKTSEIALENLEDALRSPSRTKEATEKIPLYLRAALDLKQAGLNSLSGRNAQRMQVLGSCLPHKADSVYLARVDSLIRRTH